MCRYISILVASFSMLAMSSIYAEQSKETASYRTPQFENSDVRIWKTTILPHQPLRLHRHDKGRTIIPLNSGQIKVIDKDGLAIKTYNWEAGKAYWYEADPVGELHGDLNDTDKVIEVMVVEMVK
mgnify:CR=1 FL=1